MKIKQVIASMMALSLLTLTGCGQQQQETFSQEETSMETVAEESESVADTLEIQVFVTPELSRVMNQLAEIYTQTKEGIIITFNTGDAQILTEQIKAGSACDIFFSEEQLQVDLLEQEGLVTPRTKKSVVNNQICLVTKKNSNTQVTGLETLNLAQSFALVDGSMAVGAYTRQALINLHLLETTKDVSQVTAKEVSEALGGLKINQQDSVNKVRSAVLEGSCQVGAIYYADTYGFEDQLDIIEVIDRQLTGDVFSSLCMIENQEANAEKILAAQEFYQYILSEEAKSVFEANLFDTAVENE